MEYQTMRHIVWFIVAEPEFCPWQSNFRICVFKYDAIVANDRTHSMCLYVNNEKLELSIIDIE